jgi:hypothetical protein
MKKVTVTLKENVARWARIKAAEQDKSLSKFLDDLLEERMRHESDYEAARGGFMAGKPFAFREPGEKLPARDEIHERKRLGR